MSDALLSMPDVKITYDSVAKKLIDITEIIAFKLKVHLTFSNTYVVDISCYLDVLILFADTVY